MNWKKWIPLLMAGMLTVGGLGCRPQQPVYLGGTGDIKSYYVDSALRQEIPDTQVESLGEVTGAESPLTLSNPDPSQGIWDLALQDAIRIALENGKILRNLGGVAFSSGGTQGDPSMLLSNPYSVGTIYDPALVESDPRYGVEAALSAFDAQLSASANWNKVDEQQNVASYMSTFGREQVNQADYGTFQATISKYAPTGTTYYTRLNNGYDWNVASNSREWPSNWSTYLEGGFTQSLLRGRGVQFNRIAGPGAIPGYYNGVVIARINADRALIDFEMGVRKMVSDVEEAYWNLYLAYRQLQAVKAGRDAAFETWRKVKARMDEGHAQGTRQAESQSKQQYFLYRGYTEESLSNLQKTENILRYAMGISPTDGRLIKPTDEPTIAQITFDWEEMKAEAMNRAPELRKMKWDVKQRELELIASKNFLLPQLDLQASYRLNGMGEDLIQTNRDKSSAYSSMTSGNYAGWTMGLNFGMPLGFRKEMSAVRNAELALTRGKALLQEQELELVHSLSDSKRKLDQYYILTYEHFNRRLAAQAELDAAKVTYDVGKTTLDQVLDAQRRVAEAESQYFSSLVSYNVSITKLHYRKGSLLEYDGVYLAEGPWPNKAYFDATRLARQRDAGHKINYGFTRPQVFSRGPVQQFQAPQQTPLYTPDYQGGEMIYESGYESQGVPSYEMLPNNVPAPMPAVGHQQQGTNRPVQQVGHAQNQAVNSKVQNAAYTATPGQASRVNPIASQIPAQR